MRCCTSRRSPTWASPSSNRSAIYNNNLSGSVALLTALRAAGVARLVFSSTCATYGQPPAMPIAEDTPQAPINPCGRSKLMVESVLRDVHAATPELAHAALRYFNVAGAALDGSLGEDHDPEPHLIPSVLGAALGRRGPLRVFGDDYPTPDGTCVRDYIHVEDLAAAQVRVLEALRPGDARRYNLGTGRGLSVRDSVSAAEEVTGLRVPLEVGPRRPGDLPELRADASLIRRELGWVAAHPDVHTMVESAYRWLRDPPDGYGD